MEDKKFTIPVYEDDNGKKYISAKHLNENINGVRIQETNNEKFNVTSGVPIENKIIDMAQYRENDELEEFDFDDDEPTFTEELKDLLYIPFKFENEGTKVLYYSPESYDSIMEEQ